MCSTVIIMWVRTVSSCLMSGLVTDGPFVSPICNFPISIFTSDHSGWTWMFDSSFWVPWFCLLIPFLCSNYCLAVCLPFILFLSLIICFCIEVTSFE